MAKKFTHAYARSFFSTYFPPLSTILHPPMVRGQVMALTTYGITEPSHEDCVPTVIQTSGTSNRNSAFPPWGLWSLSGRHCPQLLLGGILLPPLLAAHALLPDPLLTYSLISIIISRLSSEYFYCSSTCTSPFSICTSLYPFPAMFSN